MPLEKNRWIAAIALAAIARGGWVFASDAAPPPSMEPIEESFTEILGQTRRLDWTEEAQAIQRALDHIWRENGWTDESDQFAHDLARDVSQIPPWQFTERFDLAMGRISRRYGLSEAESLQLSLSILRESALFLARHGPTVLSHVREFVQTRVDAAPYSAEQIARWTHEDQPLVDDALRIAERFIGELRTTVKEDFRAVLERDVESYERRRRHLEGMRRRWVEGGWQPRDWGLHDDPIQMGKGRPPAPATPPRALPPRVLPPSGPTPIGATAALLPEPPTQWTVHAPSTWFVYVQAFQRRYRLDEGQTTTAESILAELVSRALDYLAAHRREVDAVAVAERGGHPLYAPVRELFAELQSRLDAIPTTPQRMKARTDITLEGWQPNQR